ncbi:hypothetical protein SHXM_06874 [Streptomyces hygroscopicus]|nr:hypothetical protein SHXM_06874 [Streptomyces hygroscopicus]
MDAHAAGPVVTPVTARTGPFCGKCGDPAVPRPPKTWRAVMTPRPDWSHEDGTPLCPTGVSRCPGDWGPYASDPVTS